MGEADETFSTETACEGKEYFFLNNFWNWILVAWGYSYVYD